MVHFDHHFAGLGVRVLEHFIHGQYASNADVAVAQFLEPLVAGLFLELAADVLEHLRELLTVVLVRDVLLAAQGLTGLFPEPGLEAADADPLAVGALVDVVAGYAAVQEIGARLRHEARAEELAGRHRQKGGDAVAHRHVDVLAAPCLLPGDDRGKDGVRGVKAATCEVGYHIEGDRWRSSRPASGAERTAERNVIDVMPDEL